jgi:very-short-patch-repair endonuclease
MTIVPISSPLPSRERVRGLGLMPRYRRRPAGIVQGQRISSTKLVLAKQMRREMTPEERILWNELRNNRRDGLHFRRQQVISGFIVDFYCDTARLAVELDGAFHDADYDAERDLALARAGVSVMRVQNHELRMDKALVLERIAARAWERIRRPNS